MNPIRYVIDASVGIKLFIDEPLSDKADMLFAHLVTNPPAQFYVPDLFYIECTNILWKYMRRFNYPLENARQDIADLSTLALHRMPTFGLIQEALNIGLSHQISIYDACYVTLAARLKIPLITADERLVNKLENTVHSVQALGEFSTLT